MSRRMDREGMHRMEPQGIINRRHCDERKRRGMEDRWWVPFAVRQGFDELNKAAYSYRRMIILRSHMSAYERADVVRSIRYELAASRACDRPRLP